MQRLDFKILVYYLFKISLSERCMYVCKNISLIMSQKKNNHAITVFASTLQLEIDRFAIFLGDDSLN